MNLRRHLAWAAAASLVLVGGCGSPAVSEPGRDPGEAGVTEVVTSYLSALADGDGPRACSLMTARAQQSLIAATRTAECPSGVAQQAAHLRGTDKQALRQADVSDVIVHNGTATVTISGPARQTLGGLHLGSRLQLTRLDDRWMVDGP